MNPEYIGWLANVFIVIGLVLIAYRLRSGFIAGCLGNSLWCVKGFVTWQPDLIAIEILVVAIQAFSWWKWRHERSPKTILQDD